MALDKDTMRKYLIQYLWQYKSAVQVKRQLENRLRNFRENMMGAKGMQYSPVPRSQTNAVGDGPASMVIRAMEIEDEIENQKKIIAETMLDVMKITDFLPRNSIERTVVEYRHIDCLNWKQICRETNYSRTTATEHYNAGIEQLLEYKKIQKVIEKYETLCNAEEPPNP